METLLPHWLWPIAGATGLGAFIDFLLGRAGQKRVKGWLETWWIKFDDVHRNNFGREEALYAVHLIDYWFGDRFFCVRRLIAVGIILLVSAACGYFIGSLHQQYLLPPLKIIIGFFVLSAIMPFVGLSFSISFTRFISAVVARNCGNTTLRNFLIFLGMLATHYFLLALWVPISQLASALFEQVVILLILGGRTRTISTVFSNFFSPWHYLYLFLASLSG